MPPATCAARVAAEERPGGHRRSGVALGAQLASAAEVVGADGAAAVQAARDGAVGRIATLLLPADTAWGPGGGRPRPCRRRRPRPGGRARPRPRTLRQPGPPRRAAAGRRRQRDEAAQRLAAAIAAKHRLPRDGRVLQRAHARRPRPPRIERLPYGWTPRSPAGRHRGPGAGRQRRADRLLRLPRQAGAAEAARAPRCSRWPKRAHDVPAALQALAEALGVSVRGRAGAAAAGPGLPSGALTPESDRRRHRRHAARARGRGRRGGDHRPRLRPGDGRRPRRTTGCR
jgi:hypothetical protein